MGGWRQFLLSHGKARYGGTRDYSLPFLPTVIAVTPSLLGLLSFKLLFVCLLRKGFFGCPGTSSVD